jgi:hypothetical protein
LFLYFFCFLHYYLPLCQQLGINSLPSGSTIFLPRQILGSTIMNKIIWTGNNKYPSRLFLCYILVVYFQFPFWTSYSGSPRFDSQPWWLAVLIEVFCGLPQSLQANSGISNLKLGHDRLLPNPFHIIVIHLPPYHQCYSIVTEKALLNRLPTNHFELFLFILYPAWEGDTHSCDPEIITVLSKAHQWTLTTAIWIQSSPVPLMFILILYYSFD